MRCTQRKVYKEGEEEATIETAERGTFSQTVRTHSNQDTTLYTVNSKKDMDGIARDGILPNYIGTLSHDHDKKFYNYGTAHATCGAHLLRELKGLFELHNRSWGKEMHNFISNMNKEKNEDLQIGKIQCEPEDFLKYSDQLDNLLEEGLNYFGQMKKGELGYKELNAMLNRLRDYKESYLLFMQDYSIPFTNNLSERDLRPCKTQQKVSGCFRSLHGLEAYAKSRSFISTLKKRSKNILDSIKKVFKGEPVLT